MPNSFFILIPIVFFLDLGVIAVGLAYSARKAGKSVFQYYDPRPGFNVLAVFIGVVLIVSGLMFLDETVDVVQTIFYTLLFNGVHVAAALVLFITVARAIMGREADPEFDDVMKSDGATE